MVVNSKLKIAVFFTIIFVALISAPTVILSFDNTVDVSIFYSVNEEEEHQHVKLVFDNTKDDSDSSFLLRKLTHSIGYTFKTYPKPHLNLISPPPELIS